MIYVRDALERRAAARAPRVTATQGAAGDWARDVATSKEQGPAFPRA